MRLTAMDGSAAGGYSPWSEFWLERYNFIGSDDVLLGLFFILFWPPRFFGDIGSLDNSFPKFEFANLKLLTHLLLKEFDNIYLI